MNMVKLTGWKEGMQKISLTTLQMEYFELSLKDAKTNVDKLLEDEEVILVCESLDKANDFIKKAKNIGVICHIE